MKKKKRKRLAALRDVYADTFAELMWNTDVPVDQCRPFVRTPDTEDGLDSGIIAMRRLIYERMVSRRAITRVVEIDPATLGVRYARCGIERGEAKPDASRSMKGWIKRLWRSLTRRERTDVVN